jgi:hypothetical protein
MVEVVPKNRGDSFVQMMRFCCLFQFQVMQLFSGNYFGLAPKRGWLIWDKMQNSSGHAELADNIDIPVRSFAYSRRNSLTKATPTQKPVSLMKWCIELKPANHHRSFCWIGTTGVAAVQMSQVHRHRARPSLFQNCPQAHRASLRTGQLSLLSAASPRLWYERS